MLLGSRLPLCISCHLVLCCVANYLLEIFLAMLNRIHTKPHSGLGGKNDKDVAIMYLVQSLDCGDTWKIIKRILPFQLDYKTLLYARVSAAELVQIATVN
jgi:hypothetical protein